MLTSDDNLYYMSCCGYLAHLTLFSILYFFRLFFVRHENLCEKKNDLQENKILNWTPDKDISDVTLAQKKK